MKLSSILHPHQARRLALILGLSLLLLACAPMSQPADEATSTDAPVSADTTIVTPTDTVSPTTALTATATITDSTTTTTTIPDLSATEQQLVEQAMNLVATESGVAATELTLISMAAVEWPDSSLGCPQPDTMYMQVITPGFQITLTAANGTVYDVHTGSDANVPMLLCTPAAGEPSTETPQNTVELAGVLTGTVTYLQRIALPAGSVINVELQDVSRADAAAAVLATQTITTTGENVPIAFALTYDPGQIEERFTYAVRARILIDGVLRWTSTERYAVLTSGNPTTGLEVIVMPTQ